MVKPTLRTKTIGAKVSAEEYAKLEAAAGEMSLSEWVRQTLLERAEGGAPVATLAEQVLLSELLALRTILLNVLYKQANGQAISVQEMQKLVDRADATKLVKATQRLRPR